MECVLVMPVYNEEECIAHVLSEWHREFQTVFSDFKLIVVNDGSTDNTASILDSLKNKFAELDLIHQTNSGHGEALYTGYSRALTYDANWVFQVDSDNQVQPRDFKALWNAKNNGSHFVMGHRKSRKDSLHRIIISRILRFLVYVIFGCKLQDMNIPFRLIKRSYLKRLMNVLPDDHVFAPNIFLAILASRDGQDLAEIPIFHAERKTGKVSIIKWRLIKACLRSLMELIRFRLNLKSSLEKLCHQSISNI